MPPQFFDTVVAAEDDLLCFSHLRWGWVFQRPQHLLTRAARDRRVFFVEEPVDSETVRMETHSPSRNVLVAQPHLPFSASAAEQLDLQRMLLDQLILDERIRAHTLWYYTPMALPFSSHLTAPLRVYDCMDELTAFAGAPNALRLLERQLMSVSDVVFTGGMSLYEAKSALHPNCHGIPSSVDQAHFAQARAHTADPADQAEIPAPRIGYCGVLDERLDLELIDEVAAQNPAWQFVFIGPVTKIDPTSLPSHANVHFLGPKQYDELPGYMGGWDVGILPFALNASTKYISPTKTPEYLAAGLPVVSTPIRDVVRTWAGEGCVRIAGTAAEMSSAIDACLSEDDDARRLKADRILATMSWDATWSRMQSIMLRTAERRVTVRVG